ncbi:MAG: hypothetical protein ACK5N8_00140 [Alphaproteobacteria bacterium]
MYKTVLFFVLALTVSSCTSNKPDTNESSPYDSTYDRFIKNVFIKEKGQNAITYEYRDVRVDEVAQLASRYCDETYGTPAHLQTIRLHKNNSRLATFHCYELQ